MTRIPASSYRPNNRVVHGTRRRTTGIVIHTIEGSAEGAESWFRNPAAGGVGTPLIVDTDDVVQICDLDALTYHAKGVNSTMIGIEHDGYARYKKSVWLSKKRRTFLRMSANRVAWICYHYKLGRPQHRRNVFGHSEIPGNDHWDPGAGWPWEFYMFLCRRAYKNLQKSNGRKWT